MLSLLRIDGLCLQGIGNTLLSPAVTALLTVSHRPCGGDSPCDPCPGGCVRSPVVPVGLATFVPLGRSGLFWRPRPAAACTHRPPAWRPEAGQRGGQHEGLAFPSARGPGPATHRGSVFTVARSDVFGAAGWGNLMAACLFCCSGPFPAPGSHGAGPTDRSVGLTGSARGREPSGDVRSAASQPHDFRWLRAFPPLGRGAAATCSTRSPSFLRTAWGPRSLEVKRCCKLPPASTPAVAVGAAELPGGRGEWGRVRAVLPGTGQV